MGVCRCGKAGKASLLSAVVWGVKAGLEASPSHLGRADQAPSSFPAAGKDEYVRGKVIWLMSLCYQRSPSFLRGRRLRRVFSPICNKTYDAGFRVLLPPSPESINSGATFLAKLESNFLLVASPLSSQKALIDFAQKRLEAARLSEGTLLFTSHSSSSSPRLCQLQPPAVSASPSVPSPAQTDATHLR